MNRREELRSKIRKILREHANDPEAAHALFDDALIEYIDDPEITELFRTAGFLYA